MEKTQLGEAIFKLQIFSFTFTVNSVLSLYSIILQVKQFCQEYEKKKEDLKWVHTKYTAQVTLLL